MKHKIFRVISASLVAAVLSISAAAAQTCQDTILPTSPDSIFVLYDNGTAIDNATGLMWMRCALGQKWDGEKCTGTASRMTWVDALKASDLNPFAGFNDWRLPNKNELESIVENRCFTPAINAGAFPATPSDYFWSSSPYAGFANAAWSVDFGYGVVNASSKSGTMHVRLVRGGEPR